MFITKYEPKYEPIQCNNCHNWLEEGDLYCRVCGTRRGKGKFEPDENIMEVIYGPEPPEWDPPEWD